MNYNYRYRLNPSDDLRERLAWTVDTCRQVYNHFLHRLNRHDDTSSYSEQKRLPDLKDWWADLRDVHSKVLQKVVQRLYDNLSTLKGRKQNGYSVGELKWKAPGEYQSFTYSQSGFKLKTRVAGPDCGSRRLVTSPSRSTATSPKAPLSRPSRSNANPPVSGPPSLALKLPTTRPRSPTR